MNSKELHVWNCDEDPSGTSEEQSICFSAFVDELWTDLETKFLEMANCHAPLIQKKVRSLDNCPWLTDNIKKTFDTPLFV